MLTAPRRGPGALGVVLTIALTFLVVALVSFGAGYLIGSLLL